MKLLLCLIVAGRMFAAADDAEIRKLLDNRVNFAKRAKGIVVGVLDDKGRRIFTEGGRAAGDARPMDGDTVFEIGSITKTFTAILLADMVLKGEVKLEDPVAKYLPERVKMPGFEGKAVTLLDLTAQVSGLPRMPSNFHPKDDTNPFADYTVDQLYEFLSGFEMKRAPGARYVYSNLGVGLLGHVLAVRAGMNYEALVTERILKPLKMTRTSITLSAGQRSNLAMGHSDAMAQVPNWDLPALAGAGALRSTANDMLTFLEANLGLKETPLGKAMEMSHQIRHATETADLSIAMGWHVFDKFKTRVLWHNGGTGGYRTWAGFVPEKKSAVVVLCNTDFGVDDIGLHLSAEDFPARMLEPKAEHKEVSVEREVLRSYVGRYALTPAFVLAVTEENGELSVQATGQPKFRLYAESSLKFFLKQVEAAVTFEKVEGGAVTGLILHQNGANQKAARVP